jgi:glucosamine-6-phosphate deaminase
MESKSTVVIANGARKAEIMQKIIEGPVTEQVPGSVLQRHINGHFFLDQEAAAKLSSTSGA